MIRHLSFWTLALVLAMAFLSIQFVRSDIIWKGNLATSCDFVNNDLSNARTSSENCLEKCNATIGCTHFTWSDWNGGSCWMKKGLVSKGDAFATNDPNMMCGVLKDSNNSYVIRSTPPMPIIDPIANQSIRSSLSLLMLFFMPFFYCLATFSF